ncbi:MAG: hypothetical protein FWG09_06105, partial [Synergistaceae bacterium]|nr:hypothetical protein [Synergistaceae bacterium]
LFRIYGLKKLLFLFLLLFFTVHCPLITVHCSHAASSDEWTWKIFVIPPDAGWDSDEGRSVKATLTWFEKDVNNDPNGLLDHDVSFVYMEDPITENTIVRDASAIVNSKCIAALNFASDEVNRMLIPLLGYAKMPVLLSGGEEVWLLDGELPYPYVFALQLYRDYRTAALAEYAKKIFVPSTNDRIVIAASRYSLNEEREARICEDILSGMTLPAISFWTDSSTFNTYRLLEAEIRSESARILFCYIGSMATREIWRASVRGIESQFQIWYPGTPNELFASYSGIIFADQSMKDLEEGIFINIKRKLWVSRAIDVKSEAAAGNAYALASWLFEAVKKGKRADSDVLVYSLANTEDIPFGNQTLDISSRTHRPETRRVYIMRVAGRAYELIDTLRIKGL